MERVELPDAQLLCELVGNVAFYGSQIALDGADSGCGAGYEPADEAPDP